jgi:hypothetical protein
MGEYTSVLTEMTNMWCMMDGNYIAGGGGGGGVPYPVCGLIIKPILQFGKVILYHNTYTAAHTYMLIPIYCIYIYSICFYVHTVRIVYSSPVLMFCPYI